MRMFLYDVRKKLVSSDEDVIAPEIRDSLSDLRRLDLMTSELAVSFQTYLKLFSNYLRQLTICVRITQFYLKELTSFW
jgi:hypothetical protein